MAYQEEIESKHPLSLEEKKKNSEIESIRRFTEFGFGKLKGKFDIFSTKFRHPRKWLSPVSKFCIVIHNLIMIYEQMSESFPCVYTGSVPISETSVGMGYPSCLPSMNGRTGG
jgi:hypothetical protein